MLRQSVHRLCTCKTYLASGSRLSQDASTHYRKAKPFSEIPSPKYVPFVGNFFQEAWKRRGKAGQDNAINFFSLTYGPICRVKVFSIPFVIVSDPTAVETVMRNEGKIPSRGKQAEDMLKWIHDKNNIPESMFFSGGESWRRIRSAMSKQIVLRRLSTFTPAMYSVANDLCDHLVLRRDADGAVNNVQEYLRNWALKAVTRIIFDEDIDTLSGKDPLGKRTVSTAAHYIASFSGILNALPIYCVLPTKPYKEYVHGIKKMHRLGKEILSTHYNKLDNAVKSGTIDEMTAVGLLDQWLIEGQLTEEEAISQACDMLAAGTETTSNTMTFAFHELAKNPEVQESLYKEIMEVMGPSREPTSEKLQKLQQVRACVRETLRLYPASVGTARVVTKNSALLGYKVPAGTLVFLNWNLSPLDPRYFTNPHEFNPSRWLKDSKDINPFVSLPFGFGPRMCYGRRIAEKEMYLLLTCILRRFKLTTDQDSLKVEQYTVLQPAEPVVINFCER